MRVCVCVCVCVCARIFWVHVTCILWCVLCVCAFYIPGVCMLLGLCVLLEFSGVYVCVCVCVCVCVLVYSGCM